jgi:DNA polymerase-1
MSLFAGITVPDRPDPENIRRLDLLQLPMLRSMMRYGIRIDPPHFADLSSRLNARMRELRRDITDEIPPGTLDRFIDLADPDPSPDADQFSELENSDPGPVNPPPEFNAESSKKVAELLYDVLHLERTEGVKIKKTKGGERLSTGKKTLEQLKRDNPVVRLILEYRECSKLDGTYARTMPRHARFHPRGPDCLLCSRHHYTDEYRVHTQLPTTRTLPGRIASKSPNLANIPTRTKLGAEIRAGFIASEGYVIAQRDFAQIELRLLADRSADPVMLEVYGGDGDIHLETAMRTFGIDSPDKVDKMLHRAPSKNTNFAVAYGITEEGLLDLMAVTFATAEQPLPPHIDKPWCKEFITKWFAVYRGVRRYLDHEEEKARRFACVWTRCGRVRRVPGVRSVHSYIQEAAVREACNHGIQGFSADIMKLAMGELWERFELLGTVGIPCYPLMTIYDEMLTETPEDYGETVEAAKEEIMDNVLRGNCLVPIKSDGKLLKRWTKE